ncbi:hypothetical protein MPL3356_110461 [Mesorhizobium plurifarium]|uniref:Uncharacterized protein n=1 Tax=Mesorhizobium plurifarium TaxID=69974 RepID=A0A090DGN7_MESPL|nr:hypothetical protein MPL3356_110461 [Mesorhizobium plurifarium]CDX21411.1 hypothetical protein MPLB_2030007 [Mesorhizobium sp. ORS 3324]CDX38160.1 hypothetical protein MPLA_2140024 [Mesorhizobium sp. ORS 3359]
MDAWRVPLLEFAVTVTSLIIIMNPVADLKSITKTTQYFLQSSSRPPKHHGTLHDMTNNKSQFCETYVTSLFNDC